MFKLYIIRAFMRQSIGLCFLFMALLSTAAGQPDHASTDISFNDAPAWVIPATVPAPRENRLNETQDGLYFLIADVQVRIEDERYVFYRRIASQVVNRTGLEDAARLQFSFDPLDDEFAVHRVRIIRDGVTLDKLKPDDFIVARQESDMASGVTDGDLTVYAEVEDVRVGDIVDYEVSWTTQSALWPGQFSTGVSASWSVPLEFYRNRILSPADKPLTVKYQNTDFTPETSSNDGYIEYLWLLEDPEIVASQDATPQTYENWGNVSVSTFPDWRTVVDSLVSDYDAKTVLPENFAEEQPWISDAEKSLNEKITAAIRYVQDEIRYVADETGVGSHLPRAPKDVIARGWGDCKDKSVLLVAILRALNVDAHVALTDNDAGYALPLTAPSPFAFDHAIAVYSVNGQRYWNDPTSFAQGGVFPDIAQPHYGYGLALQLGNGALWAITPPQKDSPEKSVREHFDFSKFETSGVSLTVVSDYTGQEADSFRRQLESKSLHQLSLDYLNYYQGQYPGIVAAEDISVDDNREANKITIREFYSFDREAYAGKAIEDAFPLRADAVLGVLSDINFHDRTAPIALPFPVNYHHEFVLAGISDFEGEPEFNLASAYLDFRRSEDISNGDTTLSYSLKTYSPEAPIEFKDEYQQVISDLNDFGYLDFTYMGNADISNLDWFYIGIIVLMIAGLIYLPVAIYMQLKRDNLLMSQSVLHPVSLTKFIILSIASVGLYAIFWMWRCWRWVNAQEDRSIMPFWRAFFSMIWFYPLFAEIRGQQETRKAPVILGALLTLGVIIFSIGGNLASRAYENETGIGALAAGVSSGLAFLFFVPLVLWVNSLNRDAPAVIKANSKWTAHTFGALFCGFIFWALIFIGAFAPQ
ncbi:DUF3857 domain-containing transglutaminase family protein [Hyphococcus sp.]|uniref:DUF3857 domain-containing transglutaminase family protein n=1 Tax=Hyphococcus sp. TaxID=2038636 RepID=UPI003CCBB00E